jgi:hypothetical protein
MSTRSLTKVIYKWSDEKTNKSGRRVLVNMYRQMDGYPSGMGADLVEFLNKVGTNHNGIQCLAAQMVAHFKDSVGGYYLEPTNAKNCGQCYDYEIILELDEEIKIKVIEVGYTNNKGKYCKGRRTLFYDNPKVYDTWIKFHED